MIQTIAPSAQPDPLANQAATIGLPQHIMQAIKTAAARTGVDFSYLVNKAAQESGFDPNAKASSSSATGLYQFTSQTWLQMVKDHGAQYGLGNYAGQITVDQNGTAHVSSSAMRKTILGMRKDPQLSAEMAGELDKQNLDSLQQNVGGRIGGTELYLAHFLGAGGASDFLNKMRANPNAKAADVLPVAASANPAVFYGNGGQPLSLTQIYRHFAQKFDSPSASATTLVASAQTPQAQMPTWSTNSATADVVASASSPAANYMSTAINGTKDGSMASSLFATMVLAQMDAGNTSSLLPMSSHSLNHDKKDGENNSDQSFGISIG